MWNLAAPAMDRALCDNAGVDIHEDSVNALLPALEQTGFACEIRVSGMECIRPRGFGVGLLNPPFSIHLENPVLEPLPCTGWGRFSPNTGADSHEYALHQALRACGIVGADVCRTRHGGRMLKKAAGCGFPLPVQEFCRGRRGRCRLASGFRFGFAQP